MIRRERREFVQKWVEMKTTTYVEEMKSFEKRYNAFLDGMEDEKIEWIRRNEHFQKLDEEYSKKFGEPFFDAFAIDCFGVDDRTLEIYLDEGF